MTDLFPEIAAGGDDKNRRYTTRHFMAWIKRTAGVVQWDLDVAADDESHHAPLWFSESPSIFCAGVDGLKQSWCPPKSWKPLWSITNPWAVFCNPPFDNLGAWVEKAWEELAHSCLLEVPMCLAMVLPGDRHEQPFWQVMVEPFRFEICRRARWGYELTIHHPPGRPGYARPGSNGRPVGTPTFPSVLLVWRKQGQP